jgi:formate dehydrogenase gamma subunit
MSTAISPFADARDRGFVLTPVLAVSDETPDLRSIRMARPEGFEFRAGQSMLVRFEAQGRRVTGRFSISSAPESDLYLEIPVNTRGPASEALLAAATVGSFLAVQPPEGSFVYPDDDDRPLVLIGGGEGAAPLMSMLRHSVASRPSRPLTLLLSVRTADQVPYVHDLRAIIRQHPNVRVGVTLTREAARPGYRAGRVDEELIRRSAPDPIGSLFYLCCPPPMLERTKRLLADLGAPSGQVRWETFDKPAAEPSDSKAGPAPPPAEAGAAPSAHVLLFPGSGAASEVLAFSRKDHAKEILRFARGEMALHWAIAVPFIICFVTGIIVKLFYGLHPVGISRDVLTFLHKVAGGCLTVFPTLAMMKNWRDYKVHVYNVKVGFSWTVDDLKWLFLFGPSTVSKKVVLPDQRKFNAAERLNFMMVMVTYPVFIVSGILLWIPGSHFVPWLVHIGTALVVPALMFGHIYMAVVNPSTRVGLTGMFSGKVDREWAKHHYAVWYREHFHEDGTPRASDSPGR